MKKKVYLRPRTNHVELKNQIHLMAGSGAGSMVVNGNGLDSELKYGDGNTKEQDPWGSAW